MIDRLKPEPFTHLSRYLSIGFITLFVSCKNDLKDINALVSKSVLQEDKASDVTFITSENAHVKAKLHATEFVRNQSAKPPYIEFRKGIYVEFFDDSLRVESTLSAKYARYYEQQGNVLVRDSIVIQNKKGERLKTEELVWNQNIQKFYTEKTVAIITKEQTLWGDGLEANQDFSWYQIKNLRGTMKVDKGQLPQ